MLVLPILILPVLPTLFCITIISVLSKQKGGSPSIILYYLKCLIAHTKAESAEDFLWLTVLVLSILILPMLVLPILVLSILILPHLFFKMIIAVLLEQKGGLQSITLYLLHSPYQSRICRRLLVAYGVVLPMLVLPVHVLPLLILPHFIF